MDPARQREDPGESAGGPSTLSGPADRLVVLLPCDPVQLGDLRRRVEEFLVGRDMPADDVFELTVAVSEAAANAIEHPVDPREDTIRIDVVIERDAIVATIRDTGHWRADGAGSPYRGRGLSLISALTDLSVDRQPDGTIVTVRRPITR